MEKVYVAFSSRSHVIEVSQMFCNFFVVRSNLLFEYHENEAVQTVEKAPSVYGSIMMVGALTRWPLLHLVYDLKATQMNMQQCSLLKELLLG